MKLLKLGSCEARKSRDIGHGSIVKYQVNLNSLVGVSGLIVGLKFFLN